MSQTIQLLKCLGEYQLDSKTWNAINPMRDVSDEVLSATYLFADKSIKIKMVTLAIVGRCRFQHNFITLGLYAYLAEFLQSPPEIFSNWDGIREYCPIQMESNRDVTYFIAELARFVALPLSNAEQLESFLFSGFTLFFTPYSALPIEILIKLHNTCHYSYPQNAIQNVLDRSRSPSPASSPRRRSRDASPTRK